MVSSVGARVLQIREADVCLQGCNEVLSSARPLVGVAADRPEMLVVQETVDSLIAPHLKDQARASRQRTHLLGVDVECLAGDCEEDVSIERLVVREGERERCSRILDSHRRSGLVDSVPQSSEEARSDEV